MKKTLCFFLILVMILAVFAACNPQKSNISTQMPIDEAIQHEEENQNSSVAAGEFVTSENDLMYFSSEDDLLSYLHSKSRADDIAKTSELEKFYMLKNIPNGYQLYKITVGVCDIGFWYLPVSRLASEDSVKEAESAQEYFLFISPRQQLSFPDVLLQHGMTEDNLLADKYYYKETHNPKLIWEYDNAVMLLYIPKHQQLMSSDDIERLCELSIKTP